MSKPIVINWFRQDLRIFDNPALFEASKQGTVLSVYILDDKNTEDSAAGSASRWWLHYSLKSLNHNLDSKLSLYKGNPSTIILDLINRYPIKAIFWNRCYEPWQINRDSNIKQKLENNGIIVNSYNGSLLWEPWAVKKENGSPYKIFTPFYRKVCLNAAVPRKPVPKPAIIELHHDAANSLTINDLSLLPAIRWDKKMEKYWDIGEEGAQKRLSRFLNKNIKNYKNGRDLPAKAYTSRLSPHLHFGEISPHQVWHQARKRENDKNIDHFCSELGWREFSYNQLYYNPELSEENIQKKFDRFPWQENKKHLIAWQKGKTGIPMVDAGMRQLWETGYMHNRARMIVGSFLVKNLLLHWKHGERWFWDCLVDADSANNSVSWQWVAGCGTDSAPYFRIFNPVTQGQKFDPKGEYVRKFIPELKNLPDKYLFSPWEAPEEILQKTNITLGENYPKPIIDLKFTRERALNAFKSI
ncbi:MAG: deoxyribodipyrimidine photo-lyase [Rickettsiaceae bacterium H1]|nr:deoxyribodipyrimidine photo-lyase [Rickettsiaceae bacterium H1]